MPKTGNREVVVNRTFLLPKNETASFEGDLRLGKLNICVIAKEDEEAKDATTSWEFTIPQQQAAVAMLSMHPTLTITLTNWKNPLGLTFTKPIKIGQQGDGTAIGMNMVVHRIGDIHLVTLELYLGGTY
jgi:hypothetical protein